MNVSFLQMCSSADPEKNMQQIKDGFALAQKDHSDFILLPENCLTMAASLNEMSAINWQPFLEKLQSLCRKHTIACVCGTIPLASQANPEKRLAASIFIDKHGEVRDQYNKIHLFDADVGDEKGVYREPDDYEAGTTPVMFCTDTVKFGMSVCFDLRFSNLYQHYQKQGAHVLLVPSAFTYTTGKKHWEVLVRARAIETQCYVIAANQYGEHDDGRRTWGHSMVVDPSGAIVACHPDGFGVKTVSLDLHSQTNTRKAMPLWPKNSDLWH